MRLLSTKTDLMKEFTDDHGVPYATLSHCWENAADEVLYDELMLVLRPYETLSPMENALTNAITKRPGFQKIEGCCHAAASLQLSWVWVDTCCIDKRSSAELSGAINSMWRWYEEASCCIVSLAGVSASRDRQGFRQSRWFTRSWTLQELIAPKRHEFYTSRWVSIISQQTKFAR